jgi:hypothetical protein
VLWSVVDADARAVGHRLLRLQCGNVERQIDRLEVELVENLRGYVSAGLCGTGYLSQFGAGVGCRYLSQHAGEGVDQSLRSLLHALSPDTHHLRQESPHVNLR